MAGNCKPDSVGAEGKYSIITSYLYNSASYLFNEDNTTTGWKYNTGYWYTTSNYMIIELYQTSNIYRSGNSSYPDYNCKLLIYQQDKYGNYTINVTNEHTIETTQIKNGEWEMFVKTLPKGKYKFIVDNTSSFPYRMDSEWYIEEIPLYLLKSNGEYYSIKDENYDIDLKMYRPIVYDYKTLKDNLFAKNALLTEITINDETFKPIDKFDNFTLVQEYNEPLKVCGTKSRSEMIVANGDIDITIADQVNSFTCTTNQTNSTIKVAFSIDKGSSWYTYVYDDEGVGAFEELNFVMPLKDYDYESEMTEEDTANYLNAKSTILTNGIDAANLSSVPFYEILTDCETIRFAYVIETQEGESTAEIDKLQINFNANGRMYKMNDNEVTVDIYEHSVLITPLIDNDIIKTNIVF